MSQDQIERSKIQRQFEEALNRHGYGFQYSVLRIASELFNKDQSNWLFEMAEVPVQVQGRDTRIDFILRLRRGYTFLLAECKRANPALSDWCFISAPFVRRNQVGEILFLEQTTKNQVGRVYSSVLRRGSLNDAYHIALEIKSDKTGDSKGSGRGVIEEAATQICRGLNGMVEFLSENERLSSFGSTVHFLPVIFTTAKIWVSDANISSADLESGNIDLQSADFRERSWIFYQYHMSPGLKHSFSPSHDSSELGEIMESEYIRSIAVVNANGIEAFLKWSSNSGFLP